MSLKDVCDLSSMLNSSEVDVNKLEREVAELGVAIKISEARVSFRTTLFQVNNIRFPKLTPKTLNSLALLCTDGSRHGEQS